MDDIQQQNPVTDDPKPQVSDDQSGIVSTPQDAPLNPAETSAETSEEAKDGDEQPQM